MEMLQDTGDSLKKKIENLNEQIEDYQRQMDRLESHVLGVTKDLIVKTEEIRDDPKAIFKIMSAKTMDELKEVI